MFNELESSSHIFLSKSDAHRAELLQKETHHFENTLSEQWGQSGDEVWNFTETIAILSRSGVLMAKLEQQEQETKWLVQLLGTVYEPAQRPVMRRLDPQV